MSRSSNTQRYMGEEFLDCSGNLVTVTGVHCNDHPLGLRSQITMNLPSERSSKSHLLDHLGTASVGRIRPEKRRSSRMALNATIGLSGEDRKKSSFSMSAKATKLNRHGASICLNRELLVGSTVVVRNQRGIQIPARVVAQLAALQGVPTYAIEFVEQDDEAKNFWGIAFPASS